MWGHRYDTPKSSQIILKWFRRRVRKFGFDVDLVNPVESVQNGAIFQALVASQESGSGMFDINGRMNPTVIGAASTLLKFVD